MNRTPRSRKSEGCTKGTVQGKRCWSTTGSVSQARWITGRSISRNLWRWFTRFFTSARRPPRLRSRTVWSATKLIFHIPARGSANQETEPVLVPMLTGRSVPTLDVHTPGTRLIAQQIIRPTGLLDPRITVRPLKHQIDETIEFCRQRTENNERVLITTLTKRTAEDLTDYLRDVGLKVRYLHSEIDAIERVEILRSLRSGEFDILVGINLLREGLDLPEVSLVCILDADKEGFLRSQTSLIQTAGRAARHVNGEVVLFADTYTDSIQKLIAITEFRRSKQIEYNEANGITPTSVSRAVQESLHTLLQGQATGGIGH